VIRYRKCDDVIDRVDETERHITGKMARVTVSTDEKSEYKNVLQ
jgi:hypothetical protein